MAVVQGVNQSLPMRTLVEQTAREVTRWVGNLHANAGALTSAVIGGGVTSFGQYAFQNCTRLSNLTLGDGVANIGGGAFLGCTALLPLSREVRPRRPARPPFPAAVAP